MNQVNIGDYNRIVLVGSSGSGKSWLSKRLADIYGYPLIHLDNEFWKPGWMKTPKDEWMAVQEELTSREKWIIDGNYDSTMEMRFMTADIVVFLDINRFVCIWRVLWRTGKKRSDFPDYLDESNILSKEFVEFCKWIWRFPETGRKTIMELHKKYPEKAFLHIRHRREIKAVLRGEIKVNGT